MLEKFNSSDLKHNRQTRNAYITHYISRTGVPKLGYMYH